MPTSTQIDHFVLLLSPEDFENVPPWLADNFTIIEGGTHSKGTSRNKLILFEDGSYLELFSWVDSRPVGVEPYADFPSWGTRPVNHVIDWALTGDDADAKYREVRSALEGVSAGDKGLDVDYDEPKGGGRKRMDGKQLQWVTIRPRRTDGDTNSAPATVPFFCLDVTDRSLRVPYTQSPSDQWPHIIQHPCGAVGVSGIDISIPRAQEEVYAQIYAALTGAEAINNGFRRQGTTVDAINFKVQTPEEATKRQENTSLDSTSRSEPCAVCLIPVSESSRVGIVALHIRTSARSGNKGPISPDEFGTLITLS